MPLPPLNNYVKLDNLLNVNVFLFDKMEIIIVPILYAGWEA